VGIKAPERLSGAFLPTRIHSRSFHFGVMAQP
jgi:hypothetical protein